MKMLQDLSEPAPLRVRLSEDMFDRVLTRAVDRANDGELVDFLGAMDTGSILERLEIYKETFARLIQDADRLERKIDVFRRAVEKRSSIQRRLRTKP